MLLIPFSASVAKPGSTPALGLHGKVVVYRKQQCFISLVRVGRFFGVWSVSQARGALDHSVAFILSSTCTVFFTFLGKRPEERNVGPLYSCRRLVFLAPNAL